MTVCGDICTCVSVNLCVCVCVLYASFYSLTHKCAGTLVVPGRIGQGMDSYVGGSSEVN